MAPTRPKGKTARKQRPHPSVLIYDAASKLQEGDVEQAAVVAKRALEYTGEGGDFELAALDLLGQIHIELGEIDAARTYFTRAVTLDENGEVDERLGGGADKFLWLAQLSEEGGKDSVGWFERGSSVLRRQIRTFSDLRKRTPEQEEALRERKQKLAGAICAMVEVYMTDLSWEADAEQKCEALVTEAIMAAPELAETWQTVANVRISQQRVEDARSALKSSLDLWKDLPSESEAIPDFAARVSLSRLLLDVEMQQEAVDVLERLVAEDDSSVEAWYLGGWALYLMGQTQRAAGKRDGVEGEEWKETWTSARQWLGQCLRLYEKQDYEDERLGEHAKELLASVAAEVGDAPEDDSEGEWEDVDGSDENGDDDEEMGG